VHFVPFVFFTPLSYNVIMKSERKKAKLTVGYNPLKESGIFDIKAPAGTKLQPNRKSIGRFSDMWRFFAMAFIIFAIFTAVGIYVNGRDFVSENKSVAYSGYDELKSGMQYLVDKDFDKAGDSFKNAEKAFKKIDLNTKFLTESDDDYLKSGLYLDSAKKLIAIGITASQIGESLSSSLKEARNIPQVFAESIKGDKSVKVTDLIKIQKTRLDDLLSKTILVQNDLTTLNQNILPSDLSDSVKKAQGYAGDFIAALEDVKKNIDMVLKMLGDKAPYTYLVLLQNSHELRATGGFIGSYILIDMNDGAISKMITKDVYETDGQLIDVVKAPPGIDKVADRFYMRDANYSPDFPTSAKQIMWFLEHSRGPSVDTVIAIDQTVAEKLLKLTGPIQLKGFLSNISADNFNDLFSYLIESKTSETSTPKQLLIDFIPVLKEKLTGLNNFSDIIGALSELIQGRHIQVYSRDADVEALAERFNVDGKIIVSAKNTDYLSVITTSIGGNKSDAFIKTQIEHRTDVSRFGELTDHLSIEKTHTWQESDFAYWKKLMQRYGSGKVDEKTLRFINGEGQNVDYMRVYAPKGSRLLSAEGVDMKNISTSEDLGYTVFGFTFGLVKAGENKSVKLVYILPYSLDLNKPMDVYRFVAQNQAGTQNVNLKKTLQASDYLKIVDVYPKTEEMAFTINPEYTAEFDQNRIFLTAIQNN